MSCGSKADSLDNFSDCFASSRFFGKLHSGVPATAAQSAPEPSVSHARSLEGGIERLDYLLNYIQIANGVSVPGSQECDCVAVFNLGVFSEARSRDSPLLIESPCLSVSPVSLEEEKNPRVFVLPFTHTGSVCR